MKYVVMKYVVMKYVGTTALLLRGPISGRVYALSPGHPGVQIDASDVGALAISPLFAAPPGS